MARPDNALEYGPDGVPYLGSRLRELRRAAEYSVTDLSKHVRRSVAALSKIETNHARPSKALLQALAEALGVEMTVLEATPLHPRLGVLRERDASDDGVEQADGRDEEIRGLKGEIRKLTAAIDRLTHRLEETEPRSLASQPHPAVSPIQPVVHSETAFGRTLACLTEIQGGLRELPQSPDGRYVTLMVEGGNRVGILRDVTDIIAGEKVDITNLDAVLARGPQRFAISISIEVAQPKPVQRTEQVQHIIQLIGKIPGVEKVHRIEESEAIAQIEKMKGAFADGSAHPPDVFSLRRGRAGTPNRRLA